MNYCNCLNVKESDNNDCILLNVKWPQNQQPLSSDLPKKSVDQSGANFRSSRQVENEKDGDRQAAIQRSFQRPRDVKKRTRLRKLQKAGHRQSAPPELNQYQIKEHGNEPRPYSLGKLEPSEGSKSPQGKDPKKFAYENAENCEDETRKFLKKLKLEDFPVKPDDRRGTVGFEGPEEEFRKRFARGLWSTDPEKMERKGRERSESGGPSETVLYTSRKTVEKRYKSCDFLSEPENQEIFNSYFTRTRADSRSSRESGVDSPGVSSIYEHEKSLSAVTRKESVPAEPEAKGDLAPCQVGASFGANLKNWRENHKFEIVVAIDFGNSYSGYAYAFKNNVRSRVEDYVFTMRRAEGGDPGLANQKLPTCLLLTPDGQFHSFGYSARDFYHDLDQSEAKKYLYFDSFKTALLNNREITLETMVQATNGHFCSALDVFAHSMRFFKRRAIMELSDRLGSQIDAQVIQWVVTVPSIWNEQAKQLLREAAYQASLASSHHPQQLLIALEAEAAALFCRELKLHEVAPDASRQFLSMPSSFRFEFKEQLECGSLKAANLKAGDSYLVVDCGGGSVDVTALQVAVDGRSLKELTRATGGPFRSNSIDQAFEFLLKEIFSEEFIGQFHRNFPASWVDLMVAFESRKRSTHPYKLNPLNVALPFSFVEFHRKFRGIRVEQAVKKFKNRHITWSSQGMLRLTPDAISGLFEASLSAIIQCISQALVDLSSVSHFPKYLFLVGGFSESPMVQNEVKKHFNSKIQVILPQEQSVATLKGAVLFGLYPEEITQRRSRLTYGIGVLHQFDPVLHPPSKRIVKQGYEWCTDVFDIFVSAGEPLTPGDYVKRRYCPACASQKEIVIQIYCTEAAHPSLVTDPGVRKCAMLRLALPPRTEPIGEESSKNLHRREVEACMRFGDTEVAVWAVEKETGAKIRCDIDFLSQ